MTVVAATRIVPPAFGNDVAENDARPARTECLRRHARYVRTAMIGSLGEQYTLVARAKGLPERRVVLRHALRNSLVPFMSLLSLEIGAVVSVSLAADAVFGLGGLAEAFLRGLAAADPFQMTALVVVTACVVSILLLASDLLVGLLDPRIRSSKRPACLSP